MTLDEAQSAKKRHIAAKLQLEPDLKVLDIGCGWGGLALYLEDVPMVPKVKSTQGPTLSRQSS
jgi:cyclopropane fatty-acyl-phospholipid synthase-like methyltransferase